MCLLLLERREGGGDLVDPKKDDNKKESASRIIFSLQLEACMRVAVASTLTIGILPFFAELFNYKVVHAGSIIYMYTPW
jgi:hypothetical protein